MRLAALFLWVPLLQAQSGSSIEAILDAMLERTKPELQLPAPAPEYAKSETLQDKLARILREEGLPENLVWIGHVESRFNRLARSPKNAVGIWQLMPETATAFGLDISGEDERTDVEKSTRAAARYLKFLYARFGDWPLVLAAYNAGHGRVEAALAKSKQRTVWSLIDAGLLPAETRAYVPAVLAAQERANP